MDKDKKEVLLRLLAILGDEGEVQEEELGEAEDRLDLYRLKVPNGFYDPGYARLRQLVWPGGGDA